jgi:hypothetical protein
VNRVTQVRVAFFAIGVVIWGYGYATDDSTVRWIGIGFLAVSLVLRFYPKPKDDGANPAG